MGFSFLFGLLLCSIVLLGGTTANAQTCTSAQKADVLILLDQSGAVNNDKAWDDAIAKMLDLFSPQIRFGLMTFRAIGELKVGIADNTVTQIKQELLSSKPTGPSRIRQSFLDATAYWRQFIPLDPVAKRPRYIFLMTDGGSNDGSPVPEIQALRTLLINGTTYDIKTFAVGFGGTVTQAELDSWAQPGGTTKGYHVTTAAALEKALQDIAREASSEVCDGIDNDCDGFIDENVTQTCTNACGTGTQTCQNGQFSPCQTTATPEICDNKDNNCDGRIDEGLTRPCYTGPTGTDGRGTCRAGLQTCTAGQFGACQGEVLPKAETCDGLDNNCDGRIDETFTDLGTACTAGVGACRRSGTLVCKADGTGTQCSAVPAPPAAQEVCNDGIDNDCNGQTDENCQPAGCTDGAKRSCYSGPTGTAGRGICKSGEQTCTGGQWGACTGEVLPGQEICDGLDNNCNGTSDENLTRTCSTLCGVGQETCTAGQWAGCTARQPSPELCNNNQDDNCDGQIDENCSNTCKDGDKRPCYRGPSQSVGVGPCKRGEQTCAAEVWGPCQGEVLPKFEACDGIDNDCNGTIDDKLTRSCKTACGEGSETCIQGEWKNCSAPQPQTQGCDGKDDDCDGQIDEGCDCRNGAKRPCYSGADGTKGVGPCVGGTQTCVGGKWETSCPGEVVPRAEICDNDIDDDCNGTVNDGCGSLCKNGEERVCTKNCGNGKQTCADGKWGECLGAPLPNPEVCDGKDNDCDGRVDELLVRACKTDCGPGSERCQGGKWSACDAPKPSPEICDGIDNDCNGKIDDGLAAVCSAGASCKDGTCPQACRNGECPQGQVCTDGLCYSRVSCDQIQCPQGKTCRSGICIDTCDLLQCPQGQVCFQGKCVLPDCYSLGCPQGQLCRQGICVRDACLNLQCPTDNFCKDGLCYPLCNCKPNETCQNGICKADPCAGKTCPSGEACQEGRCVTDPCKDIQCPSGRACVLGECRDDACLGVRCPPTLACKDGLCVDLCQGKTCAAGEICKAGACVKDDCYAKGCPQGEICKAGACIADPCAKVTCGDGAFCRLGQCVPSCTGVTCKTTERCVDGLCQADLCKSLSCKMGEVCVEGTCYPDQCKGKTCGPSQVCIPQSGACEEDPCLGVRCAPSAVCKGGQCVELCQGVNCPAGFVCLGGACVLKDCYSEGCPSGQICKAGQCTPDLCAGKTCPDGAFCREGECIKSCRAVQCEATQRCVDGTCVDDPCASISCAEGLFCDQGACKPNPCIGLACPEGRICDPKKAECTDDLCRAILCPDKARCVFGQCVSTTPIDPKNDENTGEVVNNEKFVGDKNDGGTTNDTGQTPGNCGCSQSSSDPFFLVFFLALLALSRFRRLRA